ncbi:MAG: hypothetical protein WCP32_18775, partial [Bacteroidota bacterium]
IKGWATVGNTLKWLTGGFQDESCSPHAGCHWLTPRMNPGVGDVTGDAQASRGRYFRFFKTNCCFVYYLLF